MNKFKVGDVVRLLSGGPKMTVVSINNFGDEPIVCQWFAGAKLERGSFPNESLELIKEEDNQNK